MSTTYRYPNDKHIFKLEIDEFTQAKYVVLE